jgi:hypothetical protein
MMRCEFAFVLAQYLVRGVTEQGLHTTANDLDACIAKRPVNRTVATCSVDGADLAEWLVRSGLALDDRGIQRAGTMRLNRMPNVSVEGYGKSALSEFGSLPPPGYL